MGDPEGKGSSEERKGSGFGSTMFGLLNTVTGNASKVRTVDACVHNAGSEPVFSEIGRRVRVRLVGQSCGVRRRYDDEGSSAALHSARRRASAKVKGRNGPTCCFAFGRAWALPSERPPKYAIVAFHLPVLRTCGAQPADVCVLPCASVGRTTSLVGD